MSPSHDGETPLIALDGRPSDIARMSGFAAAETLARKRRRVAAPDMLDRADR